jgi:hypothetical protein
MGQETNDVFTGVRISTDILLSVEEAVANKAHTIPPLI